jgi:hypothetical protein
MEPEQRPEPTPNIHLTGDEARLLMGALMMSTAQLPVGMSLQTYMRLASLSQVQPPKEPTNE